MKIRQINYDRLDDDRFEDVTVTMTYNEAVALVNIAGLLNGIALQKLGLCTNESLYDALSGVFNQFSDDGAPNLRLDLKTINEAGVIGREQ
jgi:hypothetical protein